MKMGKRLTEEERQARAMAALYLGEVAQSEVGGLPARTEIAKMANATAIKMMMRILTDEWDIPNAEQAAKIAKLAFDIGRIADGLPTSISSPANKENIKKLLQEAKERHEAGESAS